MLFRSVLTVSLQSCSSPPIDISYLIDRSDSSENDKHFQESRHKVCEAIIAKLERGDKFGLVPVTGEIPLLENLQSANPTIVRKQCHQPVKTSKPGTLSCPAFLIAKKQFEEPSSGTPVLISQVQVNETEKPCPEIWRSTAELVFKRGGSVLILNSTNGGGNNFRPELEAAFAGLPVQYSHENPAITVNKLIEETRRRAEVKNESK